MTSRTADRRRRARSARRLAGALLGALVASAIGADDDVRATASAARLNGFAIDPREIDAREILEGGPPRDGIPALDAPAHLPADESPWPDDEPVLGVAIGGAARAYPLSILLWHEIVNDELGGRPVLVTYCPLCGTGMVFDRRIDGRARRFGVSGLIFRSDLLLYDHETESLWSQIAARAVTGPSQGTRLRPLRSRIATWSRWKREYPKTSVLSPETGYDRRYGETPYGDYAFSEAMLFPVPEDPRYHPKMPTLGLRLADGTARAYPASELVAAGGRVREEFAGHRVEVAYDPEEQVFEVSAPEPVEVIEGYWFAWAAFHPDTSVFTSPAPEP